jgi:hypothetical protein
MTLAKIFVRFFTLPFQFLFESREDSIILFLRVHFQQFIEIGSPARGMFPVYTFLDMNYYQSAEACSRKIYQIFACVSCLPLISGA